MTSCTLESPSPNPPHTLQYCNFRYLLESYNPSKHVSKACLCTQPSSVMCYELTRVTRGETEAYSPGTGIDDCGNPPGSLAQELQKNSQQDGTRIRCSSLHSRLLSPRPSLVWAHQNSTSELQSTKRSIHPPVSASRPRCCRSPMHSACFYLPNTWTAEQGGDGSARSIDASAPRMLDSLGPVSATSSNLYVPPALCLQISSERVVRIGTCSMSAGPPDFLC